MIQGLVALLSAQLLGEILSAALGLPVPGPVIGLIVLFVWLCLRGGPSNELSQTAHTLLRYLPLLLIPPCVGLMDHLDLLAMHAELLLAIILGTTALSLVLSGLLGRCWLKDPQHGD
nr:CidA/LrgA family protein [Oceanococcus sp. HetDA_MAG_MS8]